jgi:hypothetical protein
MLYRYVFRGIGVLLVIGMITALLLAIGAMRRTARQGPVRTAPAASHRQEAP